MNPMLVPAMVVAAVLVIAGYRLARIPSSGWHRGGLIALAVATALPAALLSAYYAHVLDRAAWFYAFRAMPYAELTASGVGLSYGLVTGWLSRADLIRRSVVLKWLAPAAIWWCTVLVLLAPYAKPLIAPITVPFRDTWRDDVCIQSTPSTCGPSSAATILMSLGMRVTEQDLARECFSCGSGTENWYIARAFRRRGLDSRFVVTAPQPDEIPAPSIAGTQIGGRGGSGHFIAILARSGGRYEVGDPIAGRLLLTRDELRSRFYLTGFFLVVRTRQPRHQTAAFKSTPFLRVAPLWRCLGVAAAPAVPYLLT